MSKLDDLYRLHRLLDGRRTGLSRADLIGTHGFARATLARLVSDLRDKLNAPLIHDKDRGGYSHPGCWLHGPATLSSKPVVTRTHRA